MTERKRFPFVEADASLREASCLPYLPLTLTHRGRSVAASGLLDTGAAVNVLPYHLGVQLGADWAQQRTPVRLAGNLANLEARALIISATVGQFPPVRLAFAWAQADNVPMILGQINFLLEFDVCFYRSQRFFEVGPKRA